MSEVITKKQLESSEIQTGACHYCGQIYQFETDGRATEEQLDAWAVEKCDCGGAVMKRRRAEKAEEAKQDIFEIAEESECEQTQRDAALNLICEGIDLLVEQKIESMGVVLKDGHKMNVKINGKGNIKTEISKTTKKSKEA